ncbi:ParA family protein [Slackia heliotrinireducens]|uniref:nucleotide-binding protein n=1 Tax=Slackia heliotrinireducens TaxID=84110 RepID=UPI003314A5ED
MANIPETLLQAVKPITVIVGHYGVGKTNFSLNLALDLVQSGRSVTLVDLDVVNPYFRATESRTLLEEHGVNLIAPVFAEAGSSLDVPSLTGKIIPAINRAGEDHIVLLDVGGDDAGATALGRFSRNIAERDHAVFYVLNKFRNLVQDPADAVENLREVEAAARLKATALVNNSHLKASTTAETIAEGIAYAQEVANQAMLPLVCTTASPNVDISAVENRYSVKMYVRTPWE